MNNIKDLFNRVNTIITNSSTDTLTQIKNISNILEIDGKSATVLHFAHKDGAWNPHALTLVEDVVDKLYIKEQKINYTPEKKTRN